MRRPTYVRSSGAGQLYLSCSGIGASFRNALGNHRGARIALGLAAGHLRDHALNAAIGPAAAEIAANSVRHLGTAGMRMLVEESFGRYREPRSAEAALLGVVVDEGGLYGVRLRAASEAFGSNNLLALGLDGERSARVHGAVVHQHRAGAALSAIADTFRAGDVQVLAQGVEQRDPRLDFFGVFLAVDYQCHRNRAGAMNGDLLAFDLDHCRPGHQRYRSRNSGNLQKVAPGKIGGPVVFLAHEEFSLTRIRRADSNCVAGMECVSSGGVVLFCSQERCSWIPTTTAATQKQVVSNQVQEGRADPAGKSGERRERPQQPVAVF